MASYQVMRLLHGKADMDAEDDCDHMDCWDNLRLRQLNNWLHLPSKEGPGTLPR